MDRLLESLTTVSVALTVLSAAGLAAGRYLLASLGFLALGIGATAIVWDRWTARAGHHMELTAVLHPVALSSRDWFLLVTHGPFLLLGIILLVFRATNRTDSQ